ncbi:MAG: aminodeoxychorismate synthase component I [Bacteroidetes bacterium GWE2_29_8]|nr:MAG: aminodeoxychorismate synthase component I [Bacteroidetes bacterium GWE2_29_8]OFY24655.1 MAG: aminodeoxychorismate synthase component I [Bacteroidetes bacterium GWF2_29_10]
MKESLSILDFEEKANYLWQSKVPFIFIIDYDLKEFKVYEIDNIPNGILYDFEGISNTFTKKIEKKINLKVFPMSFANYKLAFNEVNEHINSGNTYLLNLTFPNNIDIELSLEEIFYISKAKYKLKFKEEFVVFSPETFVKIKDGYIYSYPMKGTIDSSLPDAEMFIMNNKKEIAEHATIVDLIRNDISIVADNVCVNKYRYIDKIRTNNKNLLQVSSEISGKLSEYYMENIGSLFLQLLPAGSISGAPKNKTLEIISQVENNSRGYYTGVAGIADGDSVNSFVMIRFIESRNGKLFYHSGGGITMNSNDIEEYNEMLDKIYIPN